MKLTLFKKSEDKIVKNEQKNDEYLIYANRFREKYNFNWEIERKTGRLHFNDPQGLLSARLGGTELEQLYVPEHLISCKNMVNLSKEYFLKHREFELGDYNGATIFDYYLERFVTSGHYEEEYIGLNEEVLKRGNPEDITLSYDGICAFLALAQDKILLQYKDAVMSELKRNASEEMSKVKVDENSADLINEEIGEKYLELSGAALVMFDEANERLIMEEAEKARLAEKQASLEAEYKAKEEEYGKDAEDRFAETAKAYAEVMEKLDLFSKINEDLASEE